MSKNAVSFDVTLVKPGDYYEFTIDVVNDGTIDAMIDSIVKLPELTTEQAKYIKYEITYASGDYISQKQTLTSGTKTPLKVRIEYRKDISNTDLPTTKTYLTLSFTVVYIQSDHSGTQIINNGEMYAKVISGDKNTIGSEVCIEKECFYVISSTDSTVTMLAKYNLNIGSIYFNNKANSYTNPTGIQDENMKGYVKTGQPYHGVTAFGTVPTYEGSTVEKYVNDYHDYLTTLGIMPIESRLITHEELTVLGCGGSCGNAPSFVYATSYWTGTNRDANFLYYVYSSNHYGAIHYGNTSVLGVRPVITLAYDDFN